MLLSSFLAFAQTPLPTVECSLLGFQQLCKNDILQNRPEKKDHLIRNQFEWVKQQMIAEVLQGESESQVSKDRQGWIKRIRLMKLSIEQEHCRADRPSGHFSAETFSLEICPRIAKENIARLIWLLSHELGHAMDGCMAQFPIYERTGRMSLPTQFLLMPDDKAVFDRMNSSKYFAFHELFATGGNQNREFYFQQLIANKQIREVVPPMTSTHPFTEILQCYADHQLFSENNNSVEPGLDCRKSSTSEPFADIWAARIVGAYLKEHPPTNDTDRIQSLSRDSIDLMCKPRTGKPKDFPLLTDSKWRERLPMSRNSRYMDDRFRDEISLLADRDTQRALHCTPNPQMGNCQNKFAEAMKKFGETQTGAIGAPAQVQTK